MNSYEKTRRQYLATQGSKEERQFNAGLKWYMNEKEGIIKRLQPEFEGFRPDFKTNVSYNAFVDEYVDYLKNGEAGGMGKQVSMFEKKYIERKNNIKNINM